MTLAEAIAAIRDKFEGHLADGIVFARHDPTAEPSEGTKLYRITDVRVKSTDVLLVIDPKPVAAQSRSMHMTVEQLLGRLTALPDECSQYSLEACEPEIEHDNVRLRFDYPIVTTGRIEGEVDLCLLAAIEPPRKGQRKSWWKSRTRA